MQYLSTLKRGLQIAGIALPLFLSAACGSAPESSEQKKEPTRQYNVLETTVPRGATLDGYLSHEDMAGKLSYEGASGVLAACNKDNLDAFIGQPGDRAQLRSGSDIRAPDYNKDGRIFGQPAEDTGLDLVVNGTGYSIN